MPHPGAGHALAFLLPILGLGLASCGSSSPVPQVNDAAIVRDAGIPDANACGCPGTELLSRQHLYDIWDSIQYGVLGGLRRCEVETDQLIAGGCSFQDPGIGDSLVEQTFETDRLRWVCARQTVAVPVDFFIRCVRPLDRTAEIGEGCTCPAYETPADRFFFVEQAVTVPAEGVAGVDVTCPAGSTLMGGGCKGGHDSFTGDALIMSGGIRPEDPQTWHCSWHTPGDRPLPSIATAVCLNAPGPDAVTGESVAPEVFEHVTVEETLEPRSARIIDVTCDPGDTLVSGGCHVEDARAEFAELRLKRNNALRPADNRPNTWQCAWRNPTDATPVVTATATCLKAAATQ
jgi:hypothetical protein